MHLSIIFVGIIIVHLSCIAASRSKGPVEAAPRDLLFIRVQEGGDVVAFVTTLRYNGAHTEVSDCG